MCHCDVVDKMRLPDWFGLIQARIFAYGSSFSPGRCRAFRWLAVGGVNELSLDLQPVVVSDFSGFPGHHDYVT